MSEPKTAPGAYVLSSADVPTEAQAAWQARTERLLSEFERTPEAGERQSTPPPLGFVLLLADYLWDRHGPEADFAELDVSEFTSYCSGILHTDDVAQRFAHTLTAFYRFLERTREIAPAAAARVADQLSAVVPAAPSSGGRYP